MVEMKLEGLSCANCAAKIEESLKHNEFLQDVSFSFATGKLTVNSEMEKQSLQEMIQREVDKIEEGVTVGLHQASAEKTFTLSGVMKKNWLTLFSILAFFALIFLNPQDLIRPVLYTAVYLMAGGDVVLRAIRNILKGKVFDENFLMTIATMGAFALGDMNEAVAVMLFYKVGEGFQAYAVDHSRRSIESLLNIKAEYANLIVADKIEKVSPESLKPGDRISIRAGEKVPVDAVLLDERASFDTSALTGESLPRLCSASDEILSGFINSGAPVNAEVIREFNDSAVSRILHMVENAAANKAKTEKFITKFARVYTPVVVLIALLLAITPPLLGMGLFSDWISRALIFLVISCPCALVLSVPLGFFGGLGAASRKGILIKGGNYLEALNSIDTFVFDKTGTLTEGKFSVQKVTGEETLALAVLLEKHSNHPIAHSIVKALGREPEGEASSIDEIPGRGMTGFYKEKKLLVGNKALLMEQDVELPRTEEKESLIHVAYDGRYVGNITVEDKIKASAKSLIDELKSEKNHELVMLTGDQKGSAEKVASALGIDDVHSELLPGDKLERVESLISQGRKVLFMGDGINDAPVLARAHIGAAMGGLGSDAAIEASDMVIMTDEPSKILEAMKTAGKTRSIVLQNIAFALAVKLFFLTMGALGQATMYEAVFADVGVALLAVLNSMRILKK